MVNNTSGNQARINFGKIKRTIDYPDLLEIQLKSFQDFFQLETTPENRQNEGLYKVFTDNFPISDTRNIFVLEFLDYFVDPPRYTLEECIGRGLTYAVPLKAKLKLSCNDPEHVDFETIVQDVFLGNIPYMTPKGSFVINGAERVIVSQLHRSPGVFFGQSFSSKWYKNLFGQNNSFQRGRGWNLQLILIMSCMCISTGEKITLLLHYSGQLDILQIKTFSAFLTWLTRLK